jgi:hypothetical protein
MLDALTAKESALGEKEALIQALEKQVEHILARRRVKNLQRRSLRRLQAYSRKKRTKKLVKSSENMKVQLWLNVLNKFSQFFVFKQKQNIAACFFKLRYNMLRQYILKTGKQVLKAKRVGTLFLSVEKLGSVLRKIQRRKMGWVFAVLRGKAGTGALLGARAEKLRVSACGKICRVAHQASRRCLKAGFSLIVKDSEGKRVGEEKIARGARILGRLLR